MLLYMIMNMDMKNVDVYDLFLLITQKFKIHFQNRKFYFDLSICTIHFEIFSQFVFCILTFEFEFDILMPEIQN